MMCLESILCVLSLSPSYSSSSVLAMENFRSKPCRDGRMQTESSFNGGRPTRPGHPTSMHDLRSYSTSYATSSSEQAQPTQMGKELKIKKIKKSTSVGSSKSWSLNDPELQRKKRVASYKVYAVEGKMKGSFRKSFKWVKDTYTHVVYGWW